MVAFELAQIHEKSGTPGEAARWYLAAAERFRRAQWKQKAEEALTRLGVPIPVPPAGSAVAEVSSDPVSRLEPIIAEFSEDPVFEMGAAQEGGEQESVFEQPATPVGEAMTSKLSPQTPLGHRRKRRGRRGGRGRNKGLRTGAPVAGTPAAQASPGVPAPPSVVERTAEPRLEARPESHMAAVTQLHATEEFSHRRGRESEPASSFEPVTAGSSLQMRARAGDPALSSRMVKLESQLRRLLACSLNAVDQAEEAPAGPGVFLITDTDQTCYYYIEACQTLRVGIGNLLRTGRSSREGANLKEKLADHLGINESRVGKYLKDNCAVRWLQLDEGAPLLAHFAVAVLRPIANE
jgi:hypothetical protein